MIDIIFESACKSIDKIMTHFVLASSLPS